MSRHRVEILTVQFTDSFELMNTHWYYSLLFFICSKWPANLMDPFPHSSLFYVYNLIKSEIKRHSKRFDMQKKEKC